jgi:hypothetical protein
VGKLLIRGHSDDVVCVEGDLTDEFYPGRNEVAYLTSSDGTVLSVGYGKDGFWRINRLKQGTCAFTKIEGTDEADDYSDRVTLTGEITWVIFGVRLERITSKKKDH